MAMCTHSGSDTPMTRLDGGFDRALDDLDLRTVTRSPVLDYLHRLLDEYRELDEGAGRHLHPRAGPGRPELVRHLRGDRRRPRLRGGRHRSRLHHPVDLEAVRVRDGAGGPGQRRGARAGRRRAIGQPVQLDHRRRPQPAVQPDGQRRRHRHHRSHQGARRRRNGWSGSSPPSRTSPAAAALDETVYPSESVTGDRNRAIAYLMRSFGMLDEDVDAIIDAYFRQCSLLVTCRDLAMMAATLANGGVNPITGHARSTRATSRTCSA